MEMDHHELFARGWGTDHIAGYQGGARAVHRQEANGATAFGRGRADDEGAGSLAGPSTGRGRVYSGAIQFKSKGGPGATIIQRGPKGR